MHASMWLMMALICGAGALGGIVNAFMTDNGFLLPKSEPNVWWYNPAAGLPRKRPGRSNRRPRLLGLYGPLSSYLLVGTNEALKANVSPDKIGLSLATFVGALLIGVGGARGLSSEVDKNLLRATAAEAAAKGSSAGAAQQIAIATPAQALSVARNMN